MLNVILLIVGLGMILVGANYLTDGAAAIAKRFGLSDLVVGLTVVAFGTSAPELTISVISAIEGSGGMAIGNVVGSNIFNILMIVGVVALCRPIIVEKSIMTNEIPLVVLSCVALVAIYCGGWLDGGVSELTRVDGILLLLFFAIFMRYVWSQAYKAENEKVGEEEEEGDAAEKREKGGLVRAVVMTLGGLVALVWGGDIFVDSASGIARGLGVSDAVIGLTIVALGTSAPEFAASVTAALKGNSGMAVGNVIGSNIFNILLVLGVSGAVNPLTFGGVTPVDMGLLLGSTLLFWLFGWKFRVRTITRVEGGVMAAVYVGYVIWLIINAV